jgi:twinkle protein
MEYEESTLLFKGPCEQCGSSDANAHYSDGHTHCFANGCKGRHDGEETNYKRRNTKVSDDLAFYSNADVQGLKARGISEETCRHFGVRVGLFKGEKVHMYPYHKDGAVVAVKIRTADKEFKFLGEPKHPPMFGQQLFNKGKKIVVCEGELDAMTVSQLQGNKWPVVSIPGGAPSAKKDMARQLEFFNGFEEIVLMFDQDEVGQDAVSAVAEIFPPGKVKIATLPLKDPNECLMKGKGEAVVQALWNAKAYRPDGIVGIADLYAELDREIEQGLAWFLDGLTKLTYGRRYGEIYAFGAGTGIGKTDFITQQIEYDVHTLGQKVGCIFLEQKPTETAARIAGKAKGKRFHIPDGSWTREERLQAVRELEGKVYLYDSFGETEWDVVAAKIRYMAHAEGIRIFYVDHLTAMADTSDERGSLEKIMKEMAGLANELSIIIHFVSHLATPEGKSHEEGGHVSIRHFKGARAIGFWSFFMFGLERDQQAEDEEVRQTTTFRILKDRYTGQATGRTIALGYDRNSGRLFDKSTDFVPQPSEKELDEAYGF